VKSTSAFTPAKKTDIVNGSQMGDFIEELLMKYCEMERKAKDEVARIILQAEIGKSVSAARVCVQRL